MLKRKVYEWKGPMEEENIGSRKGGLKDGIKPHKGDDKRYCDGKILSNLCKQRKMNVKKRQCKKMTMLMIMMTHLALNRYFFYLFASFSLFRFLRCINCRTNSV